MLRHVGQHHVSRDRRDLVKSTFPPLSLDVVFARVAEPAVGLHRCLGRVPGGFGGEQLGNVSVGAAIPAGGEQGGCLAAHQVGGLEFRMRPRDRELDALILADWPVEVYQISMSDASLVARQIALKQAQEHTLSHSLAGERVRDLRFNTMGMIIETYKLALLPVWVTNYRYKDNRYPLLVNGQTGTIGGDVPRSGLQKAMAGLFGS